MSNENINKVEQAIAFLNIPAEVAPPHFCYDSEENVMHCISQARGAWKKVKPSVAELIFPAIIQCELDNDEVLEFMQAIGGEPIDC